MAKTVNLELELKVSARKFWDTLRDFKNVFPKILPSVFKSIEIIEGEAGKVGCVRLVKYGEGVQVISYAKERLEAIDLETMFLTYSLIEGELLEIFKTYKTTFQIGDGENSNTCVVKWSVEFESANTEVSPPEIVTEMMKGTATNTLKTIENYLLGEAA